MVIAGFDFGIFCDFLHVKMTLFYFLPKKVTVTIPMDMLNGETHMFASVGGVGDFLIERGIPVEVPEPIAIIVNQRIDMEMQNAKLIQKLAAQAAGM